MNINKGKFKVIEQDSSFISLVGICNDNQEKIYFTDSRSGRIFKLDQSDEKITVFAENLHQPTGIAFNEMTNELWVSETSEHRLSIFDLKGNLLKKFGKRGKDSAEFNFPTFLTFDKSGNLYVADALNFKIKIFDKSGKFIFQFGEQGDASGYFSAIKGIAVDSKGHIYVVDALFHTIQIFDSNGAFLYSFGAKGNGNSEFYLPVGIFIDKSDNIYVADSFNSRIQVFKLVKR